MTSAIRPASVARTLAWAGVALTCWSSHPRAVVAQGTEPADSTFRLGRGDAVRIMVWERPELSGDFEITTDGRLAHPLLQELHVLGRTFSDVRDDIFRYLSQFQNRPQALVTPLLRISVGGGVNLPGTVSADPDRRLVEIIALAGGPVENAKEDYVQLVRRGHRERVELWGALASTGTVWQLGLRSGDQVIVPERGSVWRDYIVPSATVLTVLLTAVNLIVQISR